MPFSHMTETERLVVIARLRRKGVLIALSMIGIANGLRFSIQISGPWPPPESPGAVSMIDGNVPLEIWGAWWLVAGLLCLLSALIPNRPITTVKPIRHRNNLLDYAYGIGPAAFCVISTVWALAYFLFFVSALVPWGPAGNGRAWQSAAIYCSLALITDSALMADWGKRLARWNSVKAFAIRLVGR